MPAVLSKHATPAAQSTNKPTINLALASVPAPVTDGGRRTTLLREKKHGFEANLFVDLGRLRIEHFRPPTTEYPPLDLWNGTIFPGCTMLGGEREVFDFFVDGDEGDEDTDGYEGDADTAAGDIWLFHISSFVSLPAFFKMSRMNRHMQTLWKTEAGREVTRVRLIPNLVSSSDDSSDSSDDSSDD
jgi:hypothetical protein